MPHPRIYDNRLPQFSDEKKQTIGRYNTGNDGIGASLASSGNTSGYGEIDPVGPDIIRVPRPPSPTPDYPTEGPEHSYDEIKSGTCCIFNTRCRLAIILAFLVLLIGAGSVTLVQLVSNNKEQQQQPPQPTGGPVEPCKRTIELDLGETRNFICFVKTGLHHDNASVAKLDVDIGNSRSGSLNDYLGFTASINHDYIIINFTFSNVKCYDEGNYSIELLENGVLHRIHTFFVKVTVNLDISETVRPCNRTFELGIGETRNFICFLKTGIHHDNGNACVEKLDVDISNSSSGSLNDYLGFTASINHDNIIINFTFSKVKCVDGGNYSIMLLENGTLHRIHTFFFNVTGHSTPLKPCQKSYNVHFGRSETFECALERTIEEFTDISIEKDNNHPSGSAINNLYYNTSSDCETHNIEFTFVDARCKDEGTYLIKILQNVTVHRLHSFYLSVPENLQKPQIEKVNGSRGYISGEIMELKCEATTGCSFKNLEWIRRPKGTDIDLVLPQTITNYTLDDITSTYEVMTLFLSELTDQSNGDEYRCKIQGTDVVSDPYVVSIVTGEFCKTREIKCDYRHPSECDVWLVCESNDHPLIYPCSNGMFYKPATNCTCCNKHACEHPDIANCPYG